MNGFSDIEIYYDNNLIARPPASKSIQTTISPIDVLSSQSKIISVKGYPLFPGTYTIELSGLGGSRPSGNPVSTITINPAPASTQQAAPAQPTTPVAQLTCGGQRFYSVGSWTVLNANQLSQDVVFSIAYTSKTLEGQDFSVEFVPSQGSKLSFNGPSVFHLSTGDGWNNVPISTNKDDPARTHRMFTITLNNLPVGQGTINVLNAGQSCASIPVGVIGPVQQQVAVTQQTQPAYQPPTVTQTPPSTYRPPTVTTTGPRIPAPRKTSTTQPTTSGLPKPTITAQPAPPITKAPEVKEQKIIYSPPVFSGETTTIKIKSSEESDKIFVKVISDLGTVKTFPAIKKAKGIFEVRITP